MINPNFEVAINVLQTIIDEIEENGDKWGKELFDNSNDIKLDIEDLIELIDILTQEELMGLSYLIKTKIDYEQAKEQIINN